MPQKTNQQGLDLDSALDTYSAQAKSLKRPGLAHAAAYTAAAGAALALAPSADAAMQYTYVGQYFPIGTGTGTGAANTYAIDFDGNLIPDFTIVVQRSTSTTQGVFAFGKPMIQLGGYPAQLASSQSVGPAQLFGSASTLKLAWSMDGTNTIFYGNWLNSQQGFLGIAIPNTGSTNYAWVRLSISNDPNGIPIGFAVQDWFYADTAITTGVIPEPSPAVGLALLAVGAVGVSAWRRRKQPKA
ncbi:MAG TPA: PEP-CTERM sorting domain-containing protein [Verrucomicrobiae bacterium]|nr:PEP-CTERM sorting domain-containing protein [Verrucomicrobiae bacterium]